MFLLFSWCTHVPVLTLLWFFVLGISSSIGFGVGVPSRILFVIPYVFSHATTGFFLSDFAAVFPVVFIHACGSSLGELPPFLSSSILINYFDLDSGSGAMASFHQYITKKMESHRFACIVLLASWPNASFDMCGLSAGASNMAISSFISATLIGKSLIRAPITCAVLLSNIHNSWIIPSFVSNMWEEQKKGTIVGPLWSMTVALISLYTLWITMRETAKIEKRMR